MPHVGGKSFPYTKQGEKDAKRYGAKTGKPVKYAPPKKGK